jgi:Ribbon-helix-helix protein, copG family
MARPCSPGFSRRIPEAYNALEEELAMGNPVDDPSLSVLVPLPSDLARTIDTLAEQRGLDRAQFIVRLLRERLDGSGASFEEVVAPLAEDFRRSGMTEEDLDALVEQERQAMWDESHT